MRGAKFVRLCQRLVEQAKKNHWKLKKFPLRGDVLILSEKLELPPTMIARAILAKQGFKRTEINKALSAMIRLDPRLQGLVEIANANDPVFSPKGIEYSKWRGEEGERILSLWLDHLDVEYERDLGRGIPDFLLKKRIILQGEEINWIESKASFGDPKNRRSDEAQFRRFDKYGPGVVIYWFGLEGLSKRRIITYIDILNLLPQNLQDEAVRFLNYVPPEFKHLVRDGFLPEDN